MKLVLIEWIDASSRSEWHEIDEIKEACKPLRCRSIGWLVSEDNDCVAIASSLYIEKSEATLQGCGIMYIPNVSIVNMWVISGI